MWNVILVAAGGAAGCVCRYGVGLALPAAPMGFPWAIFLVNMLGCFLFGLLVQWTNTGATLPQQAQLALLVGFLGGFTTFSTFAFNNFTLWENGQMYALLFNMVVQNLGGVMLVMAGMAVARAR